ncbi:hypothetical protein GOV11_00060 [Candidatus Woesearchaeota archaeon]|nr:hypothetical protein [Candidatus Woesearchaeota archaeon]
MKRVITKTEEFEIMKLVLDKFLWIGVIIMAYGFYRIVGLNNDFWFGFSILVLGALVLMLFVWILMKEYNYVKR